MDEEVKVLGEPTARPSARRLPWVWQHQALVALAAVVVITGTILLLGDRLGGVESYKNYGYAGAFLVSLVGSATIVLPAPSVAVVFTLGAILNPFLVGLAAGIGETMGEVTGYMAGYGGRGVVANHRLYFMVESWMRRRGVLTMFAFSVIPNPLFDVAGMAAGAVRFPLWKFLLAVWAGKTIKGIGMALAGLWGLSYILELAQRFLG